jgi:hypothetical protein
LPYETSVRYTYVGSVSLLLKLSHAIFPELTTKMTGMVMRRYLNAADPIALSDGNVFNTVDYGMSMHGGFGLPGEPKAHRKYILGALALGFTAGFYLFKHRK